jgi:hypothetical protein
MDRKKYIVEASDDVKKVMAIGVTRGGAIWTDTTDIENLEELNSDYIKEHFGELQDEAYQAGLNDAWEAAKKLFSSMADSDIEKAFPIEWNNGGFKALMNLQPQEAIAKLKTYEDKQSDRIEVGDIVERYVDGKLDSKGIYLQEDGGYWRCLFDTGAVLMTFAYPKGQFKKTGKHYDIQSILEAMRE